MRIRARRGVCVGVDKHLQVGEEADLDGAMVTYLVGIGAVEVVPDLPPAPAAEVADESGQKSMDLDPKPSPGKSGKKEK